MAGKKDVSEEDVEEMLEEYKTTAKQKIYEESGELLIFYEDFTEMLLS